MSQCRPITERERLVARIWVMFPDSPFWTAEALQPTREQTNAALLYIAWSQSQGLRLPPQETVTP